MPVTSKRFGLLIYSTILMMVLMASGCSHLDKGWGLFSKGQYQEAKAEWELEEKEDLSEQISKAVAAIQMVDLNEKALAAKEAKDFKKMTEYSIAIVEKDKWENKDWLQKSPILQQYIDDANLMIEEGYSATMGEFKGKIVAAQYKNDYSAIIQNAIEMAAVKNDDSEKWFDKFPALQALHNEASEFVESGFNGLLTNLKNQAIKAKKEKNYQKMLRYAMGIVETKTEQNKAWFDKYPSIQEHIDEGHKLVEEAYFLVMTDLKAEKYWVDIKKEFGGYEEYSKSFRQSVSGRNQALYDLAVRQLEKQARLLGEFDEQLECAKQQFLEENYKQAMTCIRAAEAYVRKHPDIKFNTEDLDYVKQSTEQAIQIQEEIEAEKRRMAERERKRIEEENRKKAEEEARLEAERQRQEQEKIKLARAAERQRLIKLAEERRKEEERKRKIEERNRRWRAFLKQGAPLKPLVTTVFRPSAGIGSLPMNKRQKWQGGSQLPKPKDKSIASEDVYALEIEVPKTHRLTYLRNYYKSRNKNMLGAPRTQGGKRSYYTENFKGGRYYMEVKNEKAKEKKYEVKARIYKIPVTF